MALNRFLLILRDLIFDSSVDPGIPSLAAAPDAPETWPPLSHRAASIISFSWEASVRVSSVRLFGSLARGCHESQLSSIEKVSVSHTITDRSMTFCNSRIFPGRCFFLLSSHNDG
jgi:hypothetical protein